MTDQVPILRTRDTKGQFAPEQTWYNNGTYDTRLDARWAAFQHALFLGHHYERAENNPGEGSMFKIPRFGDFRLLVRPRLIVPADIVRAKRWVYGGVAREVVILTGLPREGKYGAYSWWRNAAGEFGQSSGVLWRECLWGSWVCLDTDNVACPNPDCEEVDTLSLSSARLERAYKEVWRIQMSNPDPVIP
jgi:hypothetical protein